MSRGIHAAAVLSAVFTTEAHRKSKCSISRRSSGTSSIQHNPCDWQLRVGEILDRDPPLTSSPNIMMPAPPSSAKRSSSTSSHIVGVKSQNRNIKMRLRRHTVEGPNPITTARLQNMGNVSGPRVVAPLDDTSYHGGSSLAPTRSTTLNSMEPKRVAYTSRIAGASSVSSKASKWSGESSSSDSSKTTGASYKTPEPPFKEIKTKTPKSCVPFPIISKPPRRRRATTSSVPPDLFSILPNLGAARSALKDHFKGNDLNNTSPGTNVDYYEWDDAAMEGCRKEHQQGEKYQLDQKEQQFIRKIPPRRSSMGVVGGNFGSPINEGGVRSVGSRAHNLNGKPYQREKSKSVRTKSTATATTSIHDVCGEKPNVSEEKNDVNRHNTQVGFLRAYSSTATATTSIHDVCGEKPNVSEEKNDVNRHNTQVGFLRAYSSTATATTSIHDVCGEKPNVSEEKNDINRHNANTQVGFLRAYQE